MKPYENKDFCKRCGDKNKVHVTATDEGHTSEARTICNSCEYRGYWAYGWFEPDETGEVEAKK